MADSEPQELLQTNKISRRRFLQTAGLLAASGFGGAGIGISLRGAVQNAEQRGEEQARATLVPQMQKLQEQSQKVSAQATTTAIDLVQARVSATKEALNNNPLDKDQLWSEIPTIAKTRSIVIDHFFVPVEDQEKKAENSTPPNNIRIGRGSGTIIDIRDGKIIIVTAKHAFELDKTQKTYKMNIKGSGLDINFNAEAINKYPSPAVDIGIISISSNLELVDPEAVKIGDIPNEGDILYCVSFPGTLDHRNDPHPQKFPVTRASETIIVVDSVNSGGGSGGGVYNNKGELVGVVSAVGEEGVYIIPAKPYYDQLLAQTR